MTPHDWEIQKTPLDEIPDIISSLKTSDVWFCKRCFQISLSIVGQPPDETMHGIIIPCDEAVVKQVLDS